MASLARPRGNVTGITLAAPDYTAKQLQLLREVIPEIKRVAVLWNPTLAAQWQELRRPPAPLL